MTLTQTSAPRVSTYAPSLTGTRWMAALLVFLFHVRNFGYFTGAEGWLVDVVFGAGNTGVSFFFVLSGYVLACATTGRVGPVRFWIKRIARIYPLHVVTALACLALVGVWVDPAPHDAVSVVTNLLMISSWWPSRTQVLNPVSWSLTCEAFFYLLFPLILMAVRSARSPRARYGMLGGCLALTVAAPGIAAMAQFHGSFGFLPLARLPEFAVGVVLARLVNDGEWRGPGPRVAGVLTLLGYLACRVAPTSYGVAAFTIVGITALIAATANADRHGIPTVWSGARIRHLGEMSFAFYLVHIPIMRTVQAMSWIDPHGGIELAVPVFLASLVLAWILNTYVEVPARRRLLRTLP